MNSTMIAALILLIVLIVLIEYFFFGFGKNKKRKKYKQGEQDAYEPQRSSTEFFPYQKKYLLTRNEYNFYKKLVPIADKYNLQILAKIRLADLVETKPNLNRIDSNAYFNKIKSKHIDFALAHHMAIVMLIELDDSSHSYQSRIERDVFVDDVLQRCGYTIIHTYGDTAQIDYQAGIYRNYACEPQ